MRFDYTKHSIYSAIGYLTIQTAYIEDCIEVAYKRICNKSDSKKSISAKLDEIEMVILNQPNHSEFYIQETKDFFLRRNQYIHGQIYGKTGYGSISLVHHRSNTNNQNLTLEQIDECIDEAIALLKKWQKIRLVKQN